VEGGLMSREIADKLREAESRMKVLEEGKKSEFWRIISTELQAEKVGIENLANPYEPNKAVVDLARIQEINGFIAKPDALIKHAQETKERCLKKMGMAEAKKEM